MNSTQHTSRDTLRPGADIMRLLKPLLIFVAVLWLIEIIDRLLFGGSLNGYGIIPRQLAGLAGVFFAPLLHGSFAHLLANTIPFLILGFLVMLRHENQFLGISIIIALVSGLGTWLIAPSNTVHIGASALVLGYFAYLVVNGLFERSIASLAVAMLVIIFYGRLLLSVLPAGNGISWEGHLFGLVGGAVAAYYYRPRYLF